MAAICVAIGKRPLPRMQITVSIAMNGNSGVQTINVVNRIVRIPIKDYISLLTLEIIKSNVRSPI